MTDPRPAEGPDREALRADFTAGRPAADLLAEVLLIHRPDWEAVCRGCSGGERWPCDTYTLAEAAAALLPTPPAPPLHVTQADIGHSTRMAIAHTTPPAPGDREGLRAEREQFIRSAAINVGQDIMAADVRFLFDQLDHARAALAARDTDQGAGAAVPLCPVCREPVELWADLHGEAQADCTACDWQTEVAL
jgi:hypothetical protein